MRLLSSTAATGTAPRKGRALAAFGLAVGLVLPLAACSNDDATPSVSPTPVVTVEPTEAESTPETTEPEAVETTEAEAPAETATTESLPTDALELVKVLRNRVDDLRQDAESLPGEAKSRTFKALGKTEGALGKSTGSIKAARNGNPKAKKQIDIAIEKAEYAQKALQEAMLELEGQTDDVNTTMSTNLKALTGDLDDLRAALLKE